MKMQNDGAADTLVRSASANSVNIEMAVTTRMPVHPLVVAGRGQNEINIDNNILLDGIRITAEFLLNAEVDYLCGADKCAHSDVRVNWRSSRYTRKLQLKVGAVSVSIPNLRYLHPRPSMPKRFKRLQDVFISTLESVYKNGAIESEIAALVEVMWTVHLPKELHERITAGLSLELEQWRRCAKPVEGSRADVAWDDCWLGADIFGVI